MLLSGSLLSASEFYPTITTDKDKGEIVIGSEIGMDAPVAKCEIKYTGKFSVKGKFSVTNGPASIIMWSRVDGNYYFSKIPQVQLIESGKEVSFSIPFDSSDKIADFVILELIMPKGGNATLSNLSHAKGD